MATNAIWWIWDIIMGTFEW